VNSSYVWPCLYICAGWSADADNIENSMRNIHGKLSIALQAAYLELDTIFPSRTAMFSKAELLNNRNNRGSFRIFDPISRVQPSKLLNKYYSSQQKSTVDFAIALPSSSHQILLSLHLSNHNVIGGHCNCQQCTYRGGKHIFM
jgi:hypothetical protein